MTKADDVVELVELYQRAVRLRMDLERLPPWRRAGRKRALRRELERLCGKADELRRDLGAPAAARPLLQLLEQAVVQPGRRWRRA